MKILHIITSLKIGGAEAALFNFLEKIKDDENQKHYVAYFYYGPNVEKIKALGIQVFQINGLFYRYDIFAYRQLKKLILQIKPDLIHSALWSSNILGKFLAKNLHLPIICDLHSNFTYDGKFRCFVEKFTANMADKYIAVSSSTKNGFINSVIEKIKKTKKRKIILSKIETIFNGIDIEKVQQKAFSKNISRKNFSLKETDFIIGAVGRLEKIKSYDLLIKSFHLFLNNNTFKQNSINKNAKLILIGDGSEKKNLEAMTQKLGIKENVIFMGQRLDVYSFYSIFDCFALSSVSEGLSIALLEALCFGLPIITTHRFTNHDVIEEGKNGFLIQFGNVEKYFKAIEKLYSNPSLVEKIKKENLKLVKNKYSIDNTIASYTNTYNRLIENYKIARSNQ